MDDLRAVVAANVTKALEARGKTCASLVAYRTAGRKGGARIAKRTIQYLAQGDGPSPTFDTLKGVAHALGFDPWQLLVPGFDPFAPPLLQITEQERRLREDFALLRNQLIAITGT